MNFQTLNKPITLVATELGGGHDNRDYSSENNATVYEREDYSMFCKKYLSSNSWRYREHCIRYVSS